MAHLSRNGAQVHWEWLVGDGSRDVALLVPGMSGSTRSFSTLVAAMGRTRDVLSFDPRGAGRTSITRGFSIGDIGGDAEAVLDAAGVARCDVLGISMGGMISQELALRAQERIRTLTLACTWAGRPTGVPTPLSVQARLGAAIIRTRMAKSTEALGTMYGPVLFAPSTPLASRAAFFADRMGAPRAPISGILRQVAAIRAFDSASRLASLRVPTQVLVPDEDVLMPSVNGERLAGFIPGAALRHIPGGHVFFWEHLDAFSGALEQHWATAA